MKYVCLLSFLILFSCSEKKEQNHNIILKDQFANILEKIYLVESDFKLNRVNNSDYQEILSDYNVSKTDFENTLQYYSERPGLFEKIHEEILINLEEKRNQLTD
ncbi:MAG: hypothetical protein CMP60_05090 [Flavobacteriales bacterium]|nr:hypothetical protein [Flavobacteriales bacterium]MDG1719025.1 DUF4296 domain-containing protein [Flavobacteriales bacterium]|tara:strand:+ start:350 stop:661 length:312 start_codon:yes stop_codon:yes gene_type:complete